MFREDLPLQTLCSAHRQDLNHRGGKRILQTVAFSFSLKANSAANYHSPRLPD